MGTDIVRCVDGRSKGGRGRVNHPARPSAEQHPSHSPRLEGHHQLDQEETHRNRGDSVGPSSGTFQHADS